VQPVPDNRSVAEFLHPVHAGSTGAVTDAAGELKDRTDGEICYVSGDEIDVGDSGEARDDAAGLVYFGGRSLDAFTGRWVCPDPRYELSGAQDNARAEYAKVQTVPRNRRRFEGFGLGPALAWREFVRLTALSFAPRERLAILLALPCGVFTTDPSASGYGAYMFSYLRKRE
jgi:hypothetical protein